MKMYSVSTQAAPTVEVVGPNWLVALGSALDQYDTMGGLERLACEVLPNGTVIARDASRGTRYVVQELGDVELYDDLEPLDDDVAEFETMDFGDLTPLAPEEPDPVEERLAAIDVAASAVFACQIALEAAQVVFPVESGSVILAQDGYMRFVAVVGPFAANLVGVRLPLGTGVAGFSMQKRQTVVLGNAAADPRHCPDMDRLTGYQTRQLVCLPVAQGERIHGVIEVMNLPDGQLFHREGIQRLRRVADALGARLSAA